MANQEGLENIASLSPLHLIAFLESKQGALQRTPLALAANNGRKDAVKLLLDAGANVNCRDATSAEPLSLALTGGCEDVVKLLLEKGAGNIIKDTEFSAPMLGISILNGHQGIARLLLKQGVKFRPGDSNGASLLSLALILLSLGQRASRTR